MSRHRIKGKQSRQRIIVGWDRPLNTFFVQVWDTPRATELLLWVGTNTAEVPTIAGLAELLRPYADLSSCMRSRLAEDQAAEGSAPAKHPTFVPP